MTRLSVLNTNVGNHSPSWCRLAIVPDSVAVPEIGKAAEGKYQLSTKEISARARGKWDISFPEILDTLANWESTQWGEQGFESPEKPFTTTDLVPA